jgi:hypothetical protein
MFELSWSAQVFTFRTLSRSIKPPILQTLWFKEQDYNFGVCLVRIDSRIPAEDTWLSLANSIQTLQERSLGSRSIVLSSSGAVVGLQALPSINLLVWLSAGQRLYIELANFLVDDGTNIRSYIWFRSS